MYTLGYTRGCRQQMPRRFQSQPAGRKHISPLKETMSWSRVDQFAAGTMPADSRGLGVQSQGCAKAQHHCNLVGSNLDISRAFNCCASAREGKGCVYPLPSNPPPPRCLLEVEGVWLIVAHAAVHGNLNPSPKDAKHHSIPTSLRLSPQCYGTRYLDHDVVHAGRRARSL